MLAAFQEMAQGRGQVEPDEDVLGDGVAFAGVAKYPARVKCALLGWMAFKDAVVPERDGRGHRAGEGRMQGREHSEGDARRGPQRRRGRGRRDAAGASRAARRGGTAAGLDDIEEAMRDVVDPELGINVVDLGLVYGIARRRPASPPST